MGDDQDDTADSNNILPRRKVLYCGACGMPLEYCEYGPDFESHCNPWLFENHPNLYEELQRGKISKSGSKKSQSKVEKEQQNNKPDRPWTTEERLTAFYTQYLPEKVEGIPALLEKYAGKEEKLFQALVKKYGPEPYDPYYDDGSSSDGDDDDDDDDDEGDVEATATATGQGSRNKRRGASAKKNKDGGGGGDGAKTRVLVKKEAKKKRRNLTIISGMETVPGVKLKDVSKVFSKKFAGSSSVKKNVLGKEEIIIQGDHLYEVAEMIVDTFKVDETAVYLDIEGDIVPLR